MKPDWCPQWAWDEAAVMAESVVDKNEACGCDDCLQSMSEKFSRALLAAEQRGMKRAISIAQKEVDDARANGVAAAALGAKFVRDAIRQAAKEIAP